MYDGADQGASQLVCTSSIPPEENVSYSPLMLVLLYNKNVKCIQSALAQNFH